MDQAAEDMWAKIEKLVAAGKEPVIQIPKAAEIKIPKRPGPGRPPKYGEGAKPLMHTPAGLQMGCRNFGCLNRIRRREAAITCSERCAQELLDYCRVTLEVLEKRVPATDYPMKYRCRWFTKRRTEKLRQVGRPKKEQEFDEAG